MTRRQLIARASGLAAAAIASGVAVEGGLGAAGLIPQASATDRDYTTRDTYDWLVSGVDTTPSPDADESGRLSWQRSPLMISYLTMFETTHDTVYLDRFVQCADQILDQRDNVRGVTDHAGNSLPRWRQGFRYGTGSVVVPDTAGRPALQVRIGSKGDALGWAGRLVISSPAPGQYTFSSAALDAKNGGALPAQVFANLSLDPTSPNHVVDRLYWDLTNTYKTTVKDLRTDPSAATTLALGEYDYTSEFISNFVGTGVITTCLARFAAIVRSDASLHPAYLAVSNSYAEAAWDALATFDDAWRDDGRVAWYTIDPEAPSVCAGADYPHNQNLAAANAYSHLWSATRDTDARCRARKLFQRFADDLAPTATGYSWRYFRTGALGQTGWTREDHVSTRIPYWGPYNHIEDVGHAYLDLMAAETGHTLGLVIDSSMMQRIASTFTDQVATRYPADYATVALRGKPTTRQYVDGTGAYGTYDSLVGFWNLFAGFGTGITEHAAAVMAQRAYGPTTIGAYPAMSAGFLVA